VFDSFLRYKKMNMAFNIEFGEREREIATSEAALCVDAKST